MSLRLDSHHSTRICSRRTCIDALCSHPLVLFQYLHLMLRSLCFPSRPALSDTMIAHSDIMIFWFRHRPLPITFYLSVRSICSPHPLAYTIASLLFSDSCAQDPPRSSILPAPCRAGLSSMFPLPCVHCSPPFFYPLFARHLFND